jgi:hypothetical protein
LLYPAGDIDALTERLLRLTSREERERLAKAARRIVETDFSNSVMVQRFNDVFLSFSAGIST